MGAAGGALAGFGASRDSFTHADVELLLIGEATGIVAGYTLSHGVAPFARPRPIAAALAVGTASGVILGGALLAAPGSPSQGDTSVVRLGTAAGLVLGLLAGAVGGAATRPGRGARAPTPAPPPG